MLPHHLTGATVCARVGVRMPRPEADVVLVSDRDALEKILYNLVSNAYKYTPAGGWIEMTRLRERGRTTFRIANSGKGIKPEDIARLIAFRDNPSDESWIGGNK